MVFKNMLLETHVFPKSDREGYKLRRRLSGSAFSLI